MSILDIHADDYCISAHASEDILTCLRAGKLDSISVLMNMSCFEAYAVKLREEQATWPKQPKLSVHLNFMEGHCLSDPEEIPHLVNKNGFFNIGWGTLFLWNYSPARFMMIKKELKKEIKAQTEKFIEYFGKTDGLRFDGHQHTQMIPICYWALLEVIVEQHYPTEYIRVTREPVLPYLRKVSLWKTYRPVNWIKNMLLNLYAPGMERTIQKNKPSWQKDNPSMYLWGVLMSGSMDGERVGRLLPAMRETAVEKERILEILFHPGTVLEEEISDEFSNEGANRFHLSRGRQIEYDTVMSLYTEESE
nr:ChbG/HpnK family deacetylase [uncultured Eisenbergiella sp.]